MTQSNKSNISTQSKTKSQVVTKKQADAIKTKARNKNLLNTKYIKVTSPDYSNPLKQSHSEYMMNFQKPSTLAVFPSELPQNVHPAKAHSNLPLQIPDAVENVAIIVRPEFHETVTIIQEQVDTAGIVTMKSTTHLSTNSSMQMSFVEPFELGAYGSIVPEIRLFEDFKHHSNVTVVPVPGMGVYPGLFSWDGIDIDIACSKNLNTVTMEVAVGTYNGPTLYWWWSKQFSPTIANQSFTVPNAANLKDVVFAVYPIAGPAQQQFEFSHINFTPTNATVKEYIRRQHYDLFDLPNLKPLESEYLLASEVLIFSLSAWLMNTTQVLELGGIGAVAQLPENSMEQLPVHPDDILTYLGSLQNDVVPSILLKNGIQISYVPKDRDDTFLSKKVPGLPVGKDSTKPFLVMAFKKPNTSFSASLFLDIGYQYVSNSPVTPVVNSQGNVALLFHMLSHMSGENAMGDNHEHIKRMKRNVQRFLTDPRTKAIINATGSAVKTLAPALLALI